MRGGRIVARAAVAFAIASAEPDAGADPPPPAERSLVYSRYELETIGQVLGAMGAVRDLAPEGKTVERIDVVPLDVFEPRDPAPRWLNVFHATTRRSVIRRELLVHVGDRYAQVLVDDTLRNLRRLPELSLVVVVATAGSAPDRIGVVVITKDVWSLRLSWNIVAEAAGIDQLVLAPTETNIFGTHQTARAEFILEPASYLFGVGYTIPRIDTSRVALVASANMAVNRARGTTEGSAGSLVMGEPLYSGQAPWAWDATTAWEDLVVRHYVNAQVGSFADRATGRSVPYEYRHREYAFAGELTRSFGWDVKHDFTLRVGADRNVYRPTAAGADPRTVADFVASKVPVSDTLAGFGLQYRTYTKRYLRAIDFETLALQEDFALGHDLILRAAPSFRALGSSRDVVDLYAAAQYTFALRDGLFRVYVASDTEPEIHRIADAYVNPGAHLASPTVFGLGRIVVDGQLFVRWRNYLNALDTLGGSDRLRGYPTNFFVGKDWLAYNVELRTRPVEVLTCELGGVLFYDVGNAFQGLEHLFTYPSVGAGVRVLFPQLDRIVFRADVGFPIERPIDSGTGAPIPPLAVIVSFDQAFDVPTIDPTPVLPTGGL